MSAHSKFLPDCRLGSLRSLRSLRLSNSDIKTNFDVYLAEQLKDPAFAGRFARAGEAWNVALQIAAVREKAGLSQKELARKLKTSQQQISRLESPSYEGHSLSMLRRVAAALGATIHVAFETGDQTAPMVLSESKIPYRTAKRPKAKS